MVSALCRWVMLFGPARPTEAQLNYQVEITYIDAAKQVEPYMLQGYTLKMKDPFRLACLHKATVRCSLIFNFFYVFIIISFLIANQVS